MKNNAIFTIFKKELARFFKDRRTLTALIMPGILIYVLYSLMGGVMTDSFMPDEDYAPVISVVNEPESLGGAFTTMGIFDADELDEADLDIQKELIKNGAKDLLIIFPADFDEAVENYEQSSGALASNVEIYYNSAETNSSMAYQMAVSILDGYEYRDANKFDINRTEGDKQFDMASEEDITGMMFSMLMPMLLVMLLFSGCMAVAPESISGEKERGTIATLLITPAKRSHIAIGKILALSIMALLSGASSTIGLVLSLPKLMGDTVTLDGSVYSLTDYLMLAVVILSTVLVLITLISIISAYAKSVKEATTYVTPLMILSMLIGLSGMFGASTGNSALYLIPIYNSVQSMVGIFSFAPSIVNMAITVGANLVFTVIGVFLLTRMFNSEKIMFNR